MADPYTAEHRCPYCRSEIPSCRCRSSVGNRFVIAAGQIAEVCNTISRHSFNVRNAIRPIVEVVVMMAEEFEMKIENERMSTIAKRISKIRCRSYLNRLLEDDFIG